MRRRTLRCSTSLISVTLTRLGRNVRLVLFSAWLRIWPDIGSLPINSHRRVITRLLTSTALATFFAAPQLKVAVLYDSAGRSRPRLFRVPFQAGHDQILYPCPVMVEETQK